MFEISEQRVRIKTRETHKNETESYDKDVFGENFSNRFKITV